MKTQRTGETLYLHRCFLSSHVSSGITFLCGAPWLFTGHCLPEVPVFRCHSEAKMVKASTIY